MLLEFPTWPLPSTHFHSVSTFSMVASMAVAVPGGSRPWGLLPRGRTGDAWDISYSTGRHSLKAGVNYRYNREADLQYSPFSDTGRFTIVRLDEFAAGALNPNS